jgi:hypothetical protein
MSTIPTYPGRKNFPETNGPKRIFIKRLNLVGRDLEVVENGLDEGPGSQPLHFVRPRRRLETLKILFVLKL